MRIPAIKSRKSKPKITRTWTIEVEGDEGICRIKCRTRYLILTREDLGRAITEILYRFGALPADPKPESDEMEEA